MSRPDADMFKVHSIRARLIATYLLLVIMPLGLVSWFLLQWFNNYSLTRLQGDMNTEAGIITEAVADDMLNGQTIQAKALLNNPSSPLRSQARVFLFDHNGVLIAASDSTSPQNWEKRSLSRVWRLPYPAA